MALSRPLLEMSRGSVLSLALFALLGCQGTIGETTPWEPRETEFSPGEVDFVCEGDAEVPSQLRRLSRTQLQHTVADVMARLLGPAEAETVVAALAGDLDTIPPDLRLGSETQEGQKLFFRSDQSVGEDAVAAHYRLSSAIGAQLATPERLDAMGASCATDSDDANDGACLDMLVDTVGTLTHRRPLDDTERLFYRDEVYTDGDLVGLPALADLFTVLFAQPQFLFHVEGTGGLTPYEAAARLSYHFWDTMPDAALMDAAASGRLMTDEGWTEEVERVLADDRARQSLQAFIEEWFRFDELHPASSGSGADFTQITEGLTLDAAFDDAVRAEPVELLLHTLRSGGTLEDFFLTSVTTTTNETLASIYGVSASTGEPVAVPEERRGILSRVGLLLTRAEVALPNVNSITHPILRGVFIRRQITCDYLPAAPGGAMDNLPIVDRSTTGSREATSILTGATACSACHSRINPAGYALEGFDTIGQARDEEPLFDADGVLTMALPIDDSAIVAESEAPVRGASELAAALYESEKVGACFARHYLRFALGRSEDVNDDGCMLSRIDEAIDEDRPLTEVLSLVVLDPSFRVRAGN